ncbi:MAG: hypothetical protein DMF29_04770 [Verrucomicrobia bacterium]|nr:MAG: hypothetical protein DMF29_04770 [Verrucomicrobiota bacterium]
MDGAPEFHAWSSSHLTVIFLTVGLPFLLALIVHRTKSRFLERSICFAISGLLLINYVAYLIVARDFGVTNWYRMLPLQLCDWAMGVIIVALWTGNRRWLEVAYFWGIGGTLQALITPNLRFRARSASFALLRGRKFILSSRSVSICSPVRITAFFVTNRKPLRS